MIRYSIYALVSFCALLSSSRIGLWAISKSYGDDATLQALSRVYNADEVTTSVLGLYVVTGILLTTTSVFTVKSIYKILLYVSDKYLNKKNKNIVEV